MIPFVKGPRSREFDWETSSRPSPGLGPAWLHHSVAGLGLAVAVPRQLARAAFAAAAAATLRSSAAGVVRVRTVGYRDRDRHATAAFAGEVDSRLDSVTRRGPRAVLLALGLRLARSGASRVPPGPRLERALGPAASAASAADARASGLGCIGGR